MTEITSQPTAHIPVMPREVLELLNVRRGGVYVDATVGLGGHAAAILEASAPDGRLLGLDADPQALDAARRRLEPFGDRCRLDQAWLDQAAAAASRHGFSAVDGVLCDLGVSSLQLDDPRRGFSFQQDGPLDMRLGPDAERSAAEIVNQYDEAELADVIYQLGEERRSRRIARTIVERRPIRTTGQLAEIVQSAVGPGARRGANRGARGRLHPATHVFRALRLEANGELDRLSAFLETARGMLARGGRLAAIAFHSLEDRIVKRFIREASAAGGGFRSLSKKPLRPRAEEVERNPRARSARLRAAEAV